MLREFRFMTTQDAMQSKKFRSIRPDVAFAVRKTFDIKRAGVRTEGGETRGLIILSKEDRHWKVNALENTKIQPMPTGNP